MGQTFHITSWWLKGNKTRGLKKKPLCGFFCFEAPNVELWLFNKASIPSYPSWRCQTSNPLSEWHVERSNKMHDLRVDKRPDVTIHRCWIRRCMCYLLKTRRMMESLDHHLHTGAGVFFALRELIFFPQNGCLLEVLTTFEGC